MKLDYRLYIYVGYCFELSSNNTYISNSEKRVINKVLRKRKIKESMKRETMLTLESFEYIH